MTTLKKDKKQIMKAVLDEPLAMSNGALYDRLIRLADLSQDKLIARVRSTDHGTSTEALFVLTSLNGRGLSKYLLDIVLDKNVAFRTRRTVSSDLRTRASTDTRRKRLQLLEQSDADIDRYSKAFLVHFVADLLSNRVIVILMHLLQDKNEDPIVRAEAANCIAESFDTDLFADAEIDQCLCGEVGTNARSSIEVIRASIKSKSRRRLKIPTVV